MDYFVYSLFSEKLQRHYIRQTRDIDKRIERHNPGSEKYPSKGIPRVLEASVTLQSRAETLKLERKLKNVKRNKKLNQNLARPSKYCVPTDY